MYTAIIVAAGSGTRTELGYNKVFYEVKGKSILSYCVENFLHDPDFSEIIVVHAKEELERMKTILKDPQIIFVEGGANRQASVYNGLKAVTNAVVFIHDGARPNIKKEYLEKLKSHLCDTKAMTLAIQSKDTVKIVQNNMITADIPRSQAYLLQTPQVFLTEAIREAHEALKNISIPLTDDTSIFQKHFSKGVMIVEGDEENIKVTTKFDLMILEDLL